MISPNAYLGHLASELWAMKPEQLHGLFVTLLGERPDGTPPPSGGRALYQVDSEGNAHIEIKGVILKAVPEWLSYWGIKATSTLKTQEALQAALSDADVSGVVLDVDSSGGTVSGVQALAEAVFEARQTKNVRADVPDMAASAAYWIASQAGTIEAGRGALVGSIGVYTVLVDFSKAYDKFGAKVHVVRSGDAKGIGAGDEITKKQLSYKQDLIDSMAALFVSQVAKGRCSSVKAIGKSATGEVWLADEAKERGLIDSVATSVAPTDSQDPQDPEQEPAATGTQNAPVSATAEAKPKMDEETRAEIEAKFAAMSEQIQAADAKADEAKAAAEGFKAEAETLKAQNLELRKSQCDAVIDAAATEGRVTPALREHAEECASTSDFDVDKVRSFVAGLPVQTNSDRETETPEEPKANETPKVEKGVADVMRFLGNSEEDIAKYGNAYESMSEVIQ